MANRSIGTKPNCSTFSLSNPKGRHQGDLPRLLRRLAREISMLPPNTMFLDVNIRDEITELGSWFTASVYYIPSGWDEDASAD